MAIAGPRPRSAARWGRPGLVPNRPERAGNVFNLLLAQVLEDVIELVPYLIANDPANADPARLCQSFQARGHIDAVAEDVVLLDDYVAEIDAHTKPDPSILRDFGLALGHPPLHLDSAPNRVDHARELDQHPVAGVLYDPAPVLRDFRIDQLPEMSLQAFVRAFLVDAHQPRIPRDVGGQDRGETADRGHEVPGEKGAFTKSTAKPTAALAVRLAGASTVALPLIPALPDRRPRVACPTEERWPGYIAPPPPPPSPPPCSGTLSLCAGE